MNKFFFVSCCISIGYCNSIAFAQTEDLKKTNLQFFNQTEVGGFYVDGLGFTGQTVNGVIWKNHYCLGGGIGVLLKEIYSIPLFFHGQYEFDNSGVITFFYGDLGDNIPVGNSRDLYSGLMYAVGFGMKSQTKYQIIISLGYISSKVKKIGYAYGGSQKITTFYKNNGPTLRLGIGF